jgi:hypothetical protein
MAIGSSQWMYNSGDYEIEQSLRIDSAANAYLDQTIVTTGNRRTATFSAWIKIADLKAGVADDSFIWSVGGTGAGSMAILLKTYNDTDTFTINAQDQSGNQTGYVTPGIYRDTSAWYHILLAYDNTNSTVSERVIFYVNGERVISSDASKYPQLNYDSGMNLAGQKATLGKLESIGRHFGGYYSEVNFVDGQALTPSSFGETGNYGEWKPKEYKGTYGTNGYYLPFNQDYTVEGFSATTYSGSSTDIYVGGVGFQPDLTWIKRRSAIAEHEIVDSVRGNRKLLSSDTTGAELDRSYFKSFDTDGFNVETGVSNFNSSGSTYVAWNWDMGNSYGLPHTITASGATNHSTAQQKFGTSSILFDGTTDKLTAASHADFNLLEKDFTFDMWVNFDVISNFQIVDIKGYADGLSFRMQEPGGSGKIGCYIANNNHTWNWVPSTGTWYHLALVRYGDSLKCYVDGSALTATAGGNVGGQSIAQGALQIGQELTGGTSIDFDGYIDDWRFSNIARYTGNFTVPSTTNTNDSNTILLIQSNTTNGSTTFVDSSGAAVNTSGTITSNVSANPSYGQSIVSYTGNATAGATVGHGLSSAPTMIIIKSRAAARNWTVGHSGVGWTKFLQINSSNAAETATNRWNDTAPSSTVFTLGSTGNSNSAEAVIAYCFHDVTGYSKFGSYSGTGSSGNAITTGFAPAFLMVKRTNTTGNWAMWDNARVPSGVIVGDYLQANVSDPENAPTGSNAVTFTATGFTLTGTGNYSNSSSDTFIYMAFADTREYAYWLDQSGNNNDWTSNNLTESDIMVDSPTNNFCTLNTLSTIYTGKTLSEGNLKVTGTTVNQVGGHGTHFINSSGKWYAEMVMTANAGGQPQIGLNDGSATLGGRGLLFYNDGRKGVNGGYVTYGSNTSWTTGDIIGVAYNGDDNGGECTFYKNGVSLGVAYTGLNSSLGDTFTFTCQNNANGTTTFIWNFGADSSFAGNKTAQGNQDSNGIGDFFYTPPTGFKALCTKNLPSVDVIPSEHFNTVLYTGTGSSNAVTGVGFAPNFTWAKSRSNADGNGLVNDVVGATRLLSSNTTDAEAVSANYFASLDSDGFTVGTSTFANRSGASYVAWNWKAGGSASSNTNGTITSSVSANPSAGFSIVSYTGTGANATVGHGLSKTPEMIIVKNRITTDEPWFVYSRADPTDFLRLNETDATADNAAIWNDTAPTSSVFSIGNNTGINGSSQAHIAYCFHSVDGYSKVGSYTGNGNANGPFVHCGFKPAWVMIKRTDSAENWWVLDNKRNPYNAVDTALRPNATAADVVSPTKYEQDFVSNGIKLKTADLDVNASGGTYIFLAFAESPFKHSHAR